MHLIGAFELDIQPGTANGPTSVRWPFCATPAARMDACSSRWTVPSSRRDRGIDRLSAGRVGRDAGTSPPSV